MQEIIVGEERVYQGIYHTSYAYCSLGIPGVRRGCESTTRSWRDRYIAFLSGSSDPPGDWESLVCQFPEGYELPCSDVFGANSPVTQRWFEVILRGVVTDRKREIGHMDPTVDYRHFATTEVLYAHQIPEPYPARRYPPYWGEAIGLSNQLWLAEAPALSSELRGVADRLPAMIGQIGAEKAAYANPRPVEILGVRLRELLSAERPAQSDMDRLWSQALLVMHWLTSLGPDPDAFVDAIEARTATRAHCSEALGWICGETDAAAPALLKALKSWDSEIRRRSAAALGWTRRGVDKAVPTLIRLLRSLNWGIRAASAMALGQIGPRAKMAVPALVQSLTDHEQGALAAGAWALWRIGPADEAAVPALIEAFRYSEGPCQYGQAAGAALLGRMGPRARAAVPALVEAIKRKDTDWGIRWMSASALYSVASEMSMPTLIDMLEDDDPDIRIHGVELLSCDRPGAEAAIPALIALFKHRELRVRSAGVRALARMAADAVVPALIQALKDDDPHVRESSVSALGHIGQGSNVAIPSLIEALGDKVGSVRETAAWALGRVRP
jgi:HEAT repeat protein